MSTAPELLQQLEGFVELIAVAIESKDWDELNAFLVKRQEILEQLCALSFSVFERQTAVNIMTSMQATDTQLLALVQYQKVMLQKQVASLAYDRKAIQAYQAE